MVIRSFTKRSSGTSVRQLELLIRANLSYFSGYKVPVLGIAGVDRFRARRLT